MCASRSGSRHDARRRASPLPRSRLLVAVPGARSGQPSAFEQVSVGRPAATRPCRRSSWARRRRHARVPAHRGTAGRERHRRASSTSTSAPAALTTHLSIGPTGGNMASPVADLRGMSADGRRVFFEIAENLVPERHRRLRAGDPAPTPARTSTRLGGTMTLISTGPGRQRRSVPRFAGASEDGARVFFTTEEPLSASDTDVELDIYERAGARRRSCRPGRRAATAPSKQSSAARLGRRHAGLLHDLRAAHRAGHRHRAGHIRARSGRRRRRSSPRGRRAGTGGAGAVFEGASRNGARAFFSTTEQLTSGDTDSARRHVRALGRRHDARLDRAGGRKRVVRRRRSRSCPTAGPGAVRVRRAAGVRRTPTATDVYERSGGTTTLCRRARPAATGATTRCSRAPPRTARGSCSAPPSRWSPPTPTRCSTSTSGQAGTTPRLDRAERRQRSIRGVLLRHVRRRTARLLRDAGASSCSDTDSMPDVYERAGGATTRMSTGTGGGNGEVHRRLPGRGG